MEESKDRDDGSRRSSGRKRDHGPKQAAPSVRYENGLGPVDRNQPAYEFIVNEFSDEGRVPVQLTLGEIRMLAQHYWDAGSEIANYIAGNSDYSVSDLGRLGKCEDRCFELVDQLPEDDQKQLAYMFEGHGAVFEALAAEAEDCDC